MLVYLQIIETQEEKSKFEILYRKYRSYMYRVAYTILQDRADAEDAVHAAFVKVAENIEMFDAPESRQAKCLLTTIVRNTAIDQYRKRKLLPRREYIEAQHEAAPIYTGTNQVVKCILKLPERQQDLLLLRYLYGYDLREIAKLLGLTYTNTRKIAQRARENLRKLCQEEGIEC